MSAKTLSTNLLKILPLLLVANAGSLFAAFEWPWQQAAEQKAKSTSVTSNPAPTSVMTPAKSAVQLAVKAPQQKASGFMEASETAAARPSAQLKQSEAPSSPVVNANSKKTADADVQNSFTVVAPQRNVNYEEAVKMQAKLNDLLRITSEVERLNRSKVVGVQSMVDKARTNEKILKMLASPSNAVAKVGKGDVDQILLSKKLRGMREEAEKQMALAQSHKESVLPSSEKKA